MDERFPPLTLVDVPGLVRDCTSTWFNQTLCRVNESVVRLGIVQGEYHWHQHDAEDEFFFVLEGRLRVELEDRSLELTPWTGYVVPRGMKHRTLAPVRTVMLMVEPASVVPTGDAD
jgi:mannose-6-phosphate isomerase-like protein (cupin superfamily)